MTAIKTLEDVVYWMETIGKTAQITYRIFYKPPYLVRIKRFNPSEVDKADEDSPHYMYAQAVGNTLEEAFERCLENYLKDPGPDSKVEGRKGPGRRKSGT